MATVVWSSQEGNAAEVWPESPAFQDLFTERIDDNCVEVQLLGQAGRSHYSGAIRCDGNANSIDFDLAVRIQTPPQVPLILSHYVCPPNPKLPGTVEEGEWTLIPEQLTGFPIFEKRDVLNEGTDTRHSRLVLTDLTSLKWDRQRATIRWKYRWGVQPVA